MPDRDAALHRLVDYYLHTAHAADQLLAPHQEPIQTCPLANCHPHPLADKPTALAWFIAENLNLMAAQQLATGEGWPRAALHLAWTLTTLHCRQGRLHDYRTVWETVLATTARLDDYATTAMAHRYLGDAHARLSQHAQALDHLQQALALAGDNGDTRGQAHTHRVLAFVWEQQGDDQRALGHATYALNLYRPLDQPVREADALVLAAWRLQSVLTDALPRVPAYIEALALMPRSEQFRDQIRALLAELRATLAAALHELKDAGVLADWVDPKSMAALVIAAADGAAIHLAIDPDGLDADDLLDQAVHLLLAASTIGSPAPPTSGDDASPS